MCIGNVKAPVRTGNILAALAIASASALLLARDGAVMAQQREPVLTVCELAKVARNYDGATIEIRARVLSGSEHGEYLADKNCVNTIVRVALDGTKYDRTDVAQLYREVHRYDDDISYKSTYPTVWATATGVFHVNRQEMSSMEIQIVSARNIVVRDAPPLFPHLKPHNPDASR